MAIEFVCLDCGYEVAEEDSFCSKCGSNVEDITGELALECSGCGVQIDSDSTFCSNCGGKFEDGIVGYSLPEVGTASSKRLLILLIFVVFLGVVYALVSLGLKSGESDANDSPLDSGKWVTKCRNITELNPNYYDADPSSSIDNLGGPSRFITRTQCSDVWVED